MDLSPLLFPGSRLRGLGRYTLALIRALSRQPDPPDLVYFDGVRGEEHAPPLGEEPDPAPFLDPRYDVTRYAGWARFTTRLSRTWARRPRRQGEVYLFPCADLMPWFLPERSAVIVLDLIPSCYPPWAARRKLGWLRDRIFSLRMRSAARLLSISEHTRRDALRTWGLPPERIVTVPHLMLLPPPPSPEPPARVRELLETPPGYLLFLGAREERKGIGPLLELWEERRPEARLVLVGPPSGPLPEVEERLQRLIARGDVRLLVDVEEEEKWELLRGARALLFPSRYEGYGLPLAEALLAGTPGVTFDNSSLPEACGTGGEIFPDGDFPCLLDHALQLVRDPARRAEEAERARSQQARFDQEAVGRRFLEVLSQLAPGGGG